MVGRFLVVFLSLTKYMANIDPKTLKGCKVVDVNTGAVFLVVGGRKTQKGQWFLADSSSNLYPLEDCQIVDSIKKAITICKVLADYDEIIQLYGCVATQAVWLELEEENPALMAAISALMYATSWDDFVAISYGFGVSKEQDAELNQRFREQLKAVGLNQKVASWYKEHEARNKTT